MNTLQHGRSSWRGKGHTNGISGRVWEGIQTPSSDRRFEQIYESEEDGEEAGFGYTISIRGDGGRSGPISSLPPKALCTHQRAPTLLRLPDDRGCRSTPEHQHPAHTTTDTTKYQFPNPDPPKCQAPPTRARTQAVVMHAASLRYKRGMM